MFADELPDEIWELQEPHLWKENCHPDLLRLWSVLVLRDFGRSWLLASGLRLSLVLVLNLLPRTRGSKRQACQVVPAKWILTLPWEYFSVSSSPPYISIRNVSLFSHACWLLPFAVVR